MSHNKIIIHKNRFSSGKTASPSGRSQSVGKLRGWLNSSLEGNTDLFKFLNSNEVKMTVKQNKRNLNRNDIWARSIAKSKSGVNNSTMSFDWSVPFKNLHGNDIKSVRKNSRDHLEREYNEIVRKLANLGRLISHKYILKTELCDDRHTSKGKKRAKTKTTKVPIETHILLGLMQEQTQHKRKLQEIKLELKRLKDIGIFPYINQ